MERPYLRLDPEIEIDGIVETKIGPFTLWFVHATIGDATHDGFGTMVAFADGDQMYSRRCVQPDAQGTGLTEEELEIYNQWEGRRCAAHLPGAEFWTAWHEAADPYLYPKKKGRIRVDMPLDKDTPRDIIADWLRDQGMDDAADAVRTWRPGTDHKGRHEMLHQFMDELFADFLRHNPGQSLSNAKLCDLMLWSFQQTQNPTEPK